MHPLQPRQPGDRPETVVEPAAHAGGAAAVGGHPGVAREATGPTGVAAQASGYPGVALEVRGRLGVVDYGMGNLASVERAIRHVAPGVQLNRVSAPGQLDVQDALVLPGVGAFDAAMRTLERSGLRRGLERYLASGRPLLGICLGFQLLFESSEEVPAGQPDCRGFGWLAGRVRRFPPHVTVPHMGWNRLELTEVPSPLFEGLASGSYVYFAHSYAVPVSGGAGWEGPEGAAEPGTVVAVTRTGRPDGSAGGVTFVCAAWKGMAGGVQFHPEKSGRVGLAILANYLRRALAGGDAAGALAGGDAAGAPGRGHAAGVPGGGDTAGAPGRGHAAGAEGRGHVLPAAASGVGVAL